MLQTGRGDAVLNRNSVFGWFEWFEDGREDP
jgi:hypothetical protein